MGGFVKILYPEAFYLFLLLLPVVAVLFFGYRRGKHTLRVMGGSWRFNEYYNVYVVKWFFRGLTIIFFLVFIILSLADITWGQQAVLDDRKNQDVVFVIDVSRSMLARDVKPSRLGKTAEILSGMVDTLKGSRFGVVVFKGKGIQIVPLTEDIAAIRNFLDYLGTGVVSAPGTDLESGIMEGINTFTQSSRTRFRSIVLFSDGENLSGSPQKAVQEAFGKGIPIHVVAAGTQEGTTIPLDSGELVKDKDGTAVITRVNKQLLANIAKESRGRLFSLDDPDLPLMLASTLKLESSRSIKEGFRLEEIPRYRLFLLFAFVFLILNILIRVIRWKKMF